MKYTFVIILPLVLWSSTAFAQAVLLDDNLRSKTIPEQAEEHSYSQDDLTAISQQLFDAGNPKYIWVDLLKDGFLKNGTKRIKSLNLYVYSDEPFTDSIITPDIQKAYIEKWVAFTKKLGQPLPDCGCYFLSLEEGFDAATMLHPNSSFMKTDQSELHHLHLTYTGRLMLYKQLIADEYADADKPLDLEFSEKGFIVNGHKLSEKEREKYAALTMKEFGNNYYDDQSSMSIGFLREKTLGGEIKELEDRINAVRN